MGWETALDRLLLTQVHAAEKGDARKEQVQQCLHDLHRLAGSRPATLYLLGYARVLLGLDLPQPDSEPRLQRWNLFGELRAHDRKGERTWIAEALQDPQVLADLLSDHELIPSVLPIVVRTLFWSGDLRLAVRAIQYLASRNSTTEHDLIVDAAMTDLLARLESRVDAEDQESTSSILADVIAMPSFGRLPMDVRARYHKALASRMLLGGDWSGVLQQCEYGRALCSAHPTLASALDSLSALAELRVQDIERLEPRSKRPERASAMPWLDSARGNPENAAPDALFVLALLAWESGDMTGAAECFEHAIAGYRRVDARDLHRIDRARFFQAAALLCIDQADSLPRALRLMEKALDTVKPDLESFYHVHEALKKHDRKLALRFLDAVDIGRGTSPDQLLFVALEFQQLGEAASCLGAARRILAISVDLDQRLEALQVAMTAHNMQGDREQARATFGEIRDLLMQRGAFEALEKLLRNESFVGQALDHLEIKVELAALYEEMEGRDFERAQLQIAIARSLRARKEVESLQQAHGLLMEAAIRFPELTRDELAALEKLLELHDAEPADEESGKRRVAEATRVLGRRPRVLVVGGNERQRRHHPRFMQLCAAWGLDGEWLMANYVSPQRVVSQVGEHLRSGIDLLVLLHWNRHETTEPALELARRAGVHARTIHYAGFTSLQVALGEMMERLVSARAPSS